MQYLNQGIRIHFLEDENEGEGIIIFDVIPILSLIITRYL